MGYYSQTNYPQMQGINGRYTIHDIGCFITSFCNLEQDFGNSVDPLTLNNFFRDNNVYIDVDDGVRDDVDWGFVQRWDVNTRVTQLGGAGWPQTNHAIVKFAYTSPRTGKPSTHFCKVHDFANQMIVDSWDGQIKRVSDTWYGQPVAWASYEHSAPHATIPPAPKFTVIETYTPGKQIQLNKQPTNLWGMNYDFEYMKDHPVEVHNKGEIWTVTNKVHHEDGSDYYRREGQVDGFNVVDCDDHTPPYVPPAAPEPIKLAEKYTLVTTLVYYPTADDAKQRTSKAIGPIFDGTYYVVAKDAQAYKLSKDNKTDIGWVNINDNKLPVVEAPTLLVDPPKVQNQPTDDTSVIAAPISDITPASPNSWKVTISLRADGRPVLYDAINPTALQIRDLEMKQAAIVMQPYNNHEPVPLVSTFVKDGVTYGRADKVAKQGWYYGIPMDYLREHHESLIEAAEDVIREDADTWGRFLETGFKSAERLISDIKPMLSKSTYKSRTFIDGFRKGQKK